MMRIREVIVVEGRYDQNTLSQVVDATIITLGGFQVFKDREKLEFLRRLAQKRGLIILTDSDGAGFQIRGFLKGALPKELVKQAYIPDIKGKERRKRTPGKRESWASRGCGRRYCWRHCAAAARPLKGKGDADTPGSHYQGGPVCPGAHRRTGQCRPPSGAAGAVGAAGASQCQRNAGGTEPALYPGRIFAVG